MIRMLCAGLAIVVAGVFLGCEKSGEVETAKEVTLVTTTDTLSYLIGNDIARHLKDINDEIVLDVVLGSIKEVVGGATSRIPADQERIIMQAFSMKMQQKKMAEVEGVAKKNLAEANAYLEENGKKEGVITTKSGLQYSVLVKGEGPKVSNDSAKVKVNYEGKLLSGKVFDSSIKRGQPAEFNINRVIKGWTEALKIMNVGSKYRLFIPPNLAYGPKGMPHDIKPNVMLIFEVELLSIEK